jgi:hypothetical protein
LSPRGLAKASQNSADRQTTCLQDSTHASHPFLFVSSPHAYLLGYLPLTMLLLRALNACISFLLLILLGCRQFYPVCLCSFCFASLWLTLLPLLVGAHLWSLVVSLVLFVPLHAILLLSTCVPLLPFCMLLVFCLNFMYLWFPFVKDCRSLTLCYPARRRACRMMSQK